MKFEFPTLPETYKGFEPGFVNHIGTPYKMSHAIPYITFDTLLAMAQKKPTPLEKAGYQKEIDPCYQRLSQKCMDYHLSMGVRYPITVDDPLVLACFDRLDKAPTLQMTVQKNRQSSGKTVLCYGAESDNSPLYINEGV